MLLIDLFERYQRLDAKQQLKQIAQQSGDSTQIFVSFTQINKLGINPDSYYNTPLGIYSYPITYVIRLDVTGVPFAGDEPYLQVFKLKPNTNVWDLQKSDPQQAKSNISKALQYFGFDPITDNIDDNKDVWYGMYKVLRNATDNETEDQYPVKDIGFGDDTMHAKGLRYSMITNKILRRAGFGAVRDRKGIIYSHEPNQLLVLSTQHMQLISTVNNKQSTQDPIVTWGPLGRDREIRKIFKLPNHEFYPYFVNMIKNDPNQFITLLSSLNHESSQYKRLQTGIIEQALLNNPNALWAALTYAMEYKNQRWPQLEQHIIDGKMNTDNLGYTLEKYKMRFGADFPIQWK